MEGIIGGYLSRQLAQAKDSQGHIRRVLVGLVRSYGVKAQRSIADLVADTGLQEKNCDVALERLIDLRLVRHVEPYYEVTHDFIAKRIISELADSEEREVKRCRELLATKAATHHTTGTLVSEVCNVSLPSCGLCIGLAMLDWKGNQFDSAYSDSHWEGLLWTGASWILGQLRSVTRLPGDAERATALDFAGGRS